MHCNRKRPYRTASMALRAAHGRATFGKEHHLRVYKCPECGMFHMTSQTAEEFAAAFCKSSTKEVQNDHRDNSPA